MRCTALTLAPALTARLAAVSRRLCGVNGAKPSARTAGSNTCRRKLLLSSRPPAALGNTRSSAGNPLSLALRSADQWCGRPQPNSSIITTPVDRVLRLLSEVCAHRGIAVLLQRGRGRLVSRRGSGPPCPQPAQRAIRLGVVSASSVLG